MQALGNRSSQHTFSEVPNVTIPRSVFDRSYAIKDTFDFDYLVPIMVDEVLPGDTVNCRLNTFARLATQLKPVMDNMYIDYHFFFVPNRLVWNNWEKLNGAQTDPGDSTDYIVPQIEMPIGGPVVNTSLGDKFGLPSGSQVTAAYSVNALPFRCYNLIYNEWFRSQDLQDSLVVDKDDGPDTYSDYVLRKRNKKHDYFTSLLPSPQKGPEVDLPLGTSAPVLGIGVTNTTWSAGPVTSYESDGTTSSYANYKFIDGVSVGNNSVFLERNGATTWPHIRADLTNATAATINQLREAMLMQSLFELDSRGGTRYVEILKAHFGVTSPDFRLQRPELLGLGSTRINVHPVANQSGTGTQGALTSFATSATSGDIGFSKSFTEHGYIIGLASARADLTYHQGLNRMWTRSTRYDFYWPKLSGLGEQACLVGEIYKTGVPANDEAVLGYAERHADYRYKPSEIHGAFRPTYATTLDSWHLAEEFASAPALNSTFITSTTPVARVIAVPTEPHLLFDCYFNIKHARPMPMYSSPVTLGRF